MSSDTFIGGIRAAHDVITNKVSLLRRIADDLNKISDGDPRYSACINAVAAQVSLLATIGSEIANLATEGPDDTPLATLSETPPSA